MNDQQRKHPDDPLTTLSSLRFTVGSSVPIRVKDELPVTGVRLVALSKADRGRMIESSWLFSSFGVPWSRAPAGTAKARKLSATNSRHPSPVRPSGRTARYLGDAEILEVLDDRATGTGVPSNPQPHLARSCGTTETLEPPASVRSDSNS